MKIKDKIDELMKRKEYNEKIMKKYNE